MTKKDTVSVSGGAMPKLDRAAIMSRAWAILRETYKHPAIKFSSIGRRCFSWALKQAWFEVREEARLAARLAAMPATDKAARIAVLNRTIELAEYAENWAQARHEIGAARAEIARLSA